MQFEEALHSKLIEMYEAREAILNRISSDASRQDTVSVPVIIDIDKFLQAAVTEVGQRLAVDRCNVITPAPDGGFRVSHEYLGDDKLKPGEAVKEFRRMVTRDQVDFVMGVISGGVALAVSEVAREMKVLFVDSIAQTSALTEEQGHPYVVRTTTNSTIIGRSAALAARASATAHRQP